MNPVATKLEMIHERFGGDVGIYGISIPDLTDPCVIYGVNNEGATATFVGFVQLEIVSQQFLDGLGAGADNESGVIRDDQVDKGPCRRVKHIVVFSFVDSVRG